MPNSRVRPLTENASTPATPTTAIASATAAKPPKTTAFRRSGVSTSARMSSSVAARSTGWSTDRSRTIRVTAGTSAYGILPRVDEEPAAPDHLLLERVIHGQHRARHHVLVVDVGHDADDAPGRRC